MTVPDHLAFHTPTLAPRELAYVEQALRSGHTSGDGPFTARVTAALAKELDGARVLLTTSCTHALEMVSLLLEIVPGDEVIIPSFTFVSTVNAFCMRGAVPVFCDVHSDTLNLDESAVAAALTSRTKAIVPVHYAGVACEMDSLLALAAENSIAIVEDNAHGLFGRYRGRPLGTLGALATQSFHQTKNVSAGEAGALVFGDERYYERAEVLREKGTDRSRFFRGEVDKYTWVDLGSSYLPSDVLAAALLAQLEHAASMQARRREIHAAYDAGLTAWAEAIGARLPMIPDGVESAHHLYSLRLPSSVMRTKFVAHLRERGVQATFHYQALNTSAMAVRLCRSVVACPVAEEAADTLVRLPLHPGLSAADVSRVLDAATSFTG